MSLDAHRPLTLTRGLAAEHDVIVVMEHRHRELVAGAFPELADRVVLLSLFEPEARGLERFNIVDPFGQSAAAFEACYRRIDRAVMRLLAAACDRSHS